MEELEIKITGSGTREELIKALKKVIGDIKSLKDDDLMPQSWENNILYTEIKEAE